MMLGINPGLVWSFGEHTKRHYTQFLISKGLGKSPRIVNAPRVGLKILQKWLSFHLNNVARFAPHIYGFVAGRSHILAAKVHCGAHWVYSVDINNFFPSTPISIVAEAFKSVGYGEESSSMLAKFSCLNGYLTQGAPTSPVLSNLVFTQTDNSLAAIAASRGVNLSRYADDIVFSGKGEFPTDLPPAVKAVFANTPWSLAPDKEKLQQRPNRLKVHGLLVQEDKVKLTKGYRNRIRAYRHLVKCGKVKVSDLDRVAGHLQYAAQIDSAI